MQRRTQRQTKQAHTHRDTEMRSTNKRFLSGYPQKLPFMPLWLSFLLPLCGRVHPCLLSSTQRPQCPREHSFLERKYTTNPRIPWGLPVIKHMCSLAACPSPFSLTFAYITLFLVLACYTPSHPPPHGLSDEAIASFSHPQWHLTILICMYMPSLCGRWAAEIDQQCSGMFYYMSVRDRDHTQWAYTQTCTSWYVRNIQTYSQTGLETYIILLDIPNLLKCNDVSLKIHWKLNNAT